MMLGFNLIDGNAEAFVSDIEAAVPAARVFAVELGNALDYAILLQERRGFFVISDEHLVETVAAFLGRLASSDGPITDEDVEAALLAAADDEVAFLQAFTAEMRPPARLPSGGTSGPRPAHPGHWGDVTRALAGGFHARVGNGPTKTYPYP
ncbi:MAG TPA: hypothetical protein VD838_14555 [Anaeromyxobacteraceae bacterium]|nr:hypothetical protein [Anaeromyxobacteraceae bacterium]